MSKKSNFPLNTFLGPILAKNATKENFLLFIQMIENFDNQRKRQKNRFTDKTSVTQFETINKY